MQALPFATIAFVLYVAAAIWQGMTLFRRVPPRQGMVRLLAVLGLLLHIPVVVKLVGQSPGLLPGFTTSATLLMAVAVNVVLVASLFKPVLNAGIALFPLAGIALLAATWLPNQGGHTGLTPGILLHAISSALAFAVLAIAAGHYPADALNRERAYFPGQFLCPALGTQNRTLATGLDNLHDPVGWSLSLWLARHACRALDTGRLRPAGAGLLWQ